MSEFTISEKLLENYDDYYGSDELEWRQLCAIDKASNIKKLCADLSIESVLEIGAGDGSILKSLSDDQFSKRYAALEISSSGVEAIASQGINNLIDNQLFDGYTVPYADLSFDLAILSHVIEHVEYPRKLLYEASRVAKYVYIEVPLEDTMRMKPDYQFSRVGHINFYSPKTIRRLVQTSGLEVVEQDVSNPSKAVHAFRSGKKGLLSYYLKQNALNFMYPVATRIFTYHCAIVCKNSP